MKRCLRVCRLCCNFATLPGEHRDGIRIGQDAYACNLSDRINGWKEYVDVRTFEEKDIHKENCFDKDIN